MDATGLGNVAVMIKTIITDYIISALKQSLADMHTNKTCCPRDQNLHLLDTHSSFIAMFFQQCMLFRFL